MHIGETVCSKRLPFYVDAALDAVERPQRGGKTVVLSTLALTTSPREQKECTDIMQNGQYEVEVNDITAMVYLNNN